MATSRKWRTADWNPQGIRRGSGPVNTWKDGIRETACKEEISRIKNVLIEIAGRKKIYLWVEEN
jgi:hypothetical protein